ncbi:profilin [Actinacidiphila glaucinigra]|uniref:Profilin n=1 Tax=Actinacidiphila glaucinigra TaxID=235986 RepID=A0A239NHS2_9ACTN|nr:profilin [Actinacidiphila glaucinigra]SNT53669.1 Profilin [Actinacidiphila glaucinigra]
MSWEPSCEGIVQSTPGVDAVFLADLSGSLYGTSDAAHWHPSPQETKEIVQTVRDPEATPRLAVQGENYALTARQDDTVIGKKDDKAIVAVATNKIVIVARVDENAAPQALRKLQTYAAENAS